MGRAYCVYDVWDYCCGIYFWAMKNWIINKWDWWIYFRALSTLRRMSKKSIGFTQGIVKLFVGFTVNLLRLHHTFTFNNLST